MLVLLIIFIFDDFRAIFPDVFRAVAKPVETTIKSVKSLHAKNEVCRSSGVTCGKYKDKEGIVIFPDSDLSCSIWKRVMDTLS